MDGTKSDFAISPSQTNHGTRRMMGEVAAFRPTTPGNSPGAGHSTLVVSHDSLLTQARNIKPLTTDTTLLPLKTKHSIPSTIPMAPLPKYEVASVGYSKADISAFRPTSPGDSPGVGHRHVGEDEEMKAVVEVQSPNVRVHVNEETKNGFKPTEPGHSPGVGHAFQNKNGPN
ncbi:unnamed protein product [Lupinus luteus]|uniref:Uncharacterized protein n=1 Tax=Lupinus luteus TaxID=3873 RepID=A0AAV1YA92_LUPLU